MWDLAGADARSDPLPVVCFQIELKFASVDFMELGKPKNPEKNPRGKDEKQQQSKPTKSPLCEPRKLWRTMSALTAALSLQA